MAGEELNPATYISGSQLGTDARRRFVNISSVSEASMSGNTSYNSLQATLQTNLAKRLTVLANYTWSKTYDNLPYGALMTGPAGGAPYAIPIYTPGYARRETGPADFDHRQRFVVSYAWKIPAPSHNRASNAVIGRWETTGIVQVQTGDPLTVLAGVDQSKTGLGRGHAQVVVGQSPYGPGACRTSAPCVNWLNPAAFTLPALGTYGNVVKGSYFGPRYVDWDGALVRMFPIHEQINLMFRAEYFNLLNHTNLLDPTTTLSSGGFGSITSANDPRIAQLALRLSF